MKRILATAFLAAVGVVGVVGCDKGSAGGPGASNKDKQTQTVGTADKTFTLDVPNLATTIKQGETKVIDIGIRRGNNFDQDVTLKFEGLPKGVTADASSPAIKKGQDKVSVSFKAADDAALGDHEVTVVGHPGTGEDATNKFKITVAKK